MQKSNLVWKFVRCMLFGGFIGCLFVLVLLAVINADLAFYDSTTRFVEHLQAVSVFGGIVGFVIGAFAGFLYARDKYVPRTIHIDYLHVDGSRKRW